MSTKRLQRVLVITFTWLVLADAFAAGLRTVSDPDAGWHVATGRYVWQHHAIPCADVLSFPSAGLPWIYPPFGGLLLYLAYRIGGFAALSWLSALACAGLVAYLVRKPTTPSLLLAMLAVPAIAYRTAPRADLFTTVLFAVLLGELWDFHLGEHKHLWLVPVLMLLWVNLHPGFLAGLAVLGAYVIFEAGDLVYPSKRALALQRLRTAWPWLLAGAAATLLNPWGMKIYPAALNLAGLFGPAAGYLNSSNYIQEFSRIPITSQTFLQLFDVRHLENGNSWLLLLSVLLVVLAIWRKQLGAALALAGATYFAVSHTRYLGMFAIVVVTLGSTLLYGIVNTDKRPNTSDIAEPPPLLRLSPAAPALFTAVLCVVAIVHIADYVSNRSYIHFRADSRFGAGESFWFPERAVRFIAHNEFPGNVFEAFAVGGFAALRLGPDYPDFIDGRADHLNPSLFLMEQKLVSSPPDSPLWQAAADRWNINTVLIATAGYRALQSMDANSFCHSATWRPVYLDEVSLVLVRNLPANRQWLEKLAIDCATAPLPPPTHESRIALHDYYSNAAGTFYALRRDAEAEDSLRQAPSAYSQDPHANFLLARLYQRQGRIGAAEQQYRRGLAIKDDDGAWFELGRLMAAQGHLAEAQEAMQRAIRLSSQPLVLYLALARLQLAGNQPQEALDSLRAAERSSPFRGSEKVAPELYAEIAEAGATAYAEMDDWNSAVQQQQQAVRLTPAVAARWSRLADYLQRSGQTQAASEAREKAQELSAPAPANP